MSFSIFPRLSQFSHGYFQVKLKAMKQHENQVDELGKLATHIVETKENSGTVKADMDTFSEKWTLVFQKLSK